MNWGSGLERIEIRHNPEPFSKYGLKGPPKGQRCFSGVFFAPGKQDVFKMGAANGIRNKTAGKDTGRIR